MTTLRTTEIIEILANNTGSYIHHNTGEYFIKNEDGSKMTKTCGESVFLINPTKEMIDDLLDSDKIKYAGNNKYILNL